MSSFDVRSGESKNRRISGETRLFLPILCNPITYKAAAGHFFFFTKTRRELFTRYKTLHCVCRLVAECSSLLSGGGHDIYSHSSQPPGRNGSSVLLTTGLEGGPRQRFSQKSFIHGAEQKLNVSENVGLFASNSSQRKLLPVLSFRLCCNNTDRG